MDVRIFIEKKSEYRSEALSLLEELKADFPLEGLRVIDIYDIFDLEEELRDKVGAIIADTAVDDVYYELDLTGKKYLAYEYLPGQYDQEANIARELIRLARPETRAVVQKGKVVIFEGDVDPEKRRGILLTRRTLGERISQAGKAPYSSVAPRRLCL